MKMPYDGACDRFASAQATQHTVFQQAGAVMLRDLEHNAKVEGGWASLASVIPRKDRNARLPLEDHMPSYFLAEACKYLYLLYNDSFYKVGLVWDQTQARGLQCEGCCLWVACSVVWECGHCMIVLSVLCMGR